MLRTTGTRTYGPPGSGPGSETTGQATAPGKREKERNRDKLVQGKYAYNL